ncbi:putative inactive purple acid phosphatase 29 [Phytophthora citrophthora]|uniref:Inactive purple acid phosphatase 29 n=1 Tax=Phytophthora citrophthora TaxID=4793 RepID=A0AAD9GA19_9STRA|nr:putative inactive purple acid phosphatase 29 [Phytophthora citrophthora]
MSYAYVAQFAFYRVAHWYIAEESFGYQMENFEPSPSKKFKFPTLKTWHKVFLACFGVLAVTAAVALALVLTQHSSESEASFSPVLSRVAVTNLTFVQASTDDGALEKCVKLGWTPTGVQLETTPNVISYLCMQQSRSDAAFEDTAKVDNVMVLRRLVVVSGTKGCPSSMENLLSPRAGICICMEFSTVSEAFRSQKYVSDMMTTTEGFYNHNKPGWLTWSVNLMVNSDSGVFLSVSYPIVPIVDLKILTKISAGGVYTACEAIEPKGEWESPRMALRSKMLTSTSNISDITICTKRLQALETKNASVLLNFSVVQAAQACPVNDGITTTEISAGAIKLCAEWGDIEFNATNLSSSSFLSDLALYETMEIEAADTNISTLIPGNWSLLDHSATGSMHTFFLTRYFAPFTAVSNTSTKNDTVSSSVEAVAPPNTIGKLSFRALQIADLHLTGNPDHPCSNKPKKPIRASILESAWVISRELKEKNGASPSPNKADDPLYSQCREAVMIAFLDEILDIEQPDFVVFTGDNVQAYNSINDALGISIFTERVESRGIPWTAVFGNHDIEGGLSRDEMLKLMVDGKLFSHMKYGPRNIGGVGNYEVNVVAPVDGPWGVQGSTVFRMYFLDSHSNVDTDAYPLVNTQGYEWIKESQIDFYKELSSAHTNANDSVPAVMYFHIPIPEYALVSSSTQEGVKNESVASAHVNCGLFSALVEMGDVKATFVGHDHVNEYCYLRQGIQLCYGGGIGFGRAYGSDEFERRARIVEWSYGSGQTHKIRSWKRHFDDPTHVKSLEVLYSEELLGQSA